MSPGDTNERKPKGKRPAHRPASTAKPKALTIPKAKRALYLELVADGIHPGEAARKCGPNYTGRLFKSLAHNDPQFAAAREAALAAREDGLVEKGREEMVSRQLGDDASLKTDRGLHNLMILIDPDYRAAHRQGAQVSVTTEMEVTNVHIAIEGAQERLVQKLAPVLELAAARDAQTGDRGRAS